MTLERLLEVDRLRDFAARSEAAGDGDVERALLAPEVGLGEFLTLLSPAAARHLEPLARRARDLTRARFGRVVQLYAPLYVSNECTNACAYCGFHRDNDIPRRTLGVGEVLEEADVLWRQGFRSLLLVSGEAPGAVPPELLEELARRLRPRFPTLSVEVYPVGEGGYRRLVQAGADGLTLYQETYDRELYASVHDGPKADFDNRLDAPSRGGRAGMRRLGVGALLGLGPWRLEAVAVGLHARWLQREHWRAQVGVSFPRLRKAPGRFRPPHPVSDRDVVQMACALRLFLPDAALTLSTREAPAFRDGLAAVCVTHMSAGSRTDPGGYTRPGEAGEQFGVEDRRPAAEVAATLLRLGVEPVWKDWDDALRTPAPEARP